MRNKKHPTFAALLMPLALMPAALVAQQPLSPQQLPGAIEPDLVEISRGSGVQTDGPDRLLGTGTDYMSWFSVEGMKFAPALGAAAKETRYVSMRPAAVRRGDVVLQDEFGAVPTQNGEQVRYAYAPSLQERYDVCDNGVEVSWQFAEKPAGSGDLVVSYDLATNLPFAGESDGSLQFVENGLGGVSIGAVTGIDARGRHVAGDLSFANGTLEMSLPESFVDTATYPIVLDPLIGGVIQVSGTGFNDADPDVAYDATNQIYLVAWLRTFSGSLVVPRARMVDLQGGVGSLITLNSSGICGRPRVANHSFGNKFGIVFEEQIGGFHGIKFRAVSAQTGAVTNTTVLATSTGVGLFRDPDIGGIGHSTNSHGFVAVWEDNIVDEIRARRVFFDLSGNLLTSGTATIFADNSNPFATNTYTQPVISKQAGSGLKFMVAARRVNSFGPSRHIDARVISATSMATLASTGIDSSSTDNLASPDVGGADGKWVLAWERHLGTSSSTRVERRTAAYDGSSVTLGSIVGFGSAFQDVESPTIGYSQARTWLGFEQFSALGGQRSVNVTAIDSGTATACGTEFTQNTVTAGARIVVATDHSGGVNHGSNALAAYNLGTTIYVQRLRSYGSAGTHVSLGGQCGAGGSQTFSHLPGIGSSIYCGVNGLSPSAVFSVFNLTTDQIPVTCGTCDWAPFSVTAVEVPAGGNAGLAFVIPCLPSLVGSQFVTQWTTFDPAASGCFLAPEFSMTDRSLMTLGN